MEDVVTSRPFLVTPARQTIRHNPPVDDFPRPPHIAMMVSSLRALCLLSALPGALAICYFPDGSVAADTPCQDGTDPSVCCGSGYACLANGICKATGKELQKSDATIFVRGSCTDKTWRSSKCPLFCIDQNNGGGAGIMQCQNTLEDLFYCAGLDSSRVDCSAKKGVLFFQRKKHSVCI